MRESSCQAYFHFTWATWDRLPLLVGETKERVYSCIQEKCKMMNTDVLAIGGVADHIHLLVKLSPDVSVATLAQGIKGSSSHLVGLANRKANRESFFKWQGAYGVCTISMEDIPRVRHYIENQEQHHRDKTEDSELEYI